MGFLHTAPVHTLVETSQWQELEKIHCGELHCASYLFSFKCLLTIISTKCDSLQVCVFVTQIISDKETTTFLPTYFHS